MPGLKRIFTVTILALCLPSPGNAQPQCTNGFDLDRSSGQCLDIDECWTIPEACRGDMMCVNQNGGYLCIPRTNPVYRGPYSNPYSNPYSGPYPAAAPLLSAPNYATISRPLICRFGYQMDEGNQCVVSSTNQLPETRAQTAQNSSLGAHRPAATDRNPQCRACTGPGPATGSQPSVLRLHLAQPNLFGVYVLSLTQLVYNWKEQKSDLQLRMHTTVFFKVYWNELFGIMITHSFGFLIFLICTIILL